MANIETLLERFDRTFVLVGVTDERPTEAVERRGELVWVTEVTP
jgi:hypothetical protein